MESTPFYEEKEKEKQKEIQMESKEYIFGVKTTQQKYVIKMQKKSLQ